MSDCARIVPLLGARPLELLEPDEVALVDAHLATCASCPALLREVESALATLEKRPELPGDGWDRVARKIAAAPVVRLSCTFCHGGLERAAAVYCASCLAPHHGDCFQTHGRCAAPGCGETRIVRPRGVARGGRRILVAALALALPVAAAAILLDRGPIEQRDGDRKASPKPAAATAPAAPVASPAAPRPVPEQPRPQPQEPLVRVLYVAGYPSWSYRYTKNAFLKAPNVVLQAWLASADPEFPQEHTAPDRRSPRIDASYFTPLKALPAKLHELDRYDVFVLDNVSPETLGPETLRGIASLVAEGRGLVLVAGQPNEPAAFLGTPLEPLLPLVPERSAAKGRERPLGYGLTDPGRRSPILSFGAGAAERERLFGGGFPGIHWVSQVQKLQAGALVLLETQPEGRPIFVTGLGGRGRVFVSLTDETWQWRREVGDRYYAPFWTNALRWAAGGRDLDLDLSGSRRVKARIVAVTAGTVLAETDEGLAFLPRSQVTGARRDDGTPADLEAFESSATQDTVGVVTAGAGNVRVARARGEAASERLLRAGDRVAAWGGPGGEVLLSNARATLANGAEVRLTKDGLEVLTGTVRLSGTALVLASAARVATQGDTVQVTKTDASTQFRCVVGSIRVQGSVWATQLERACGVRVLDDRVEALDSNREKIRIDPASGGATLLAPGESFAFPIRSAR